MASHTVEKAGNGKVRIRDLELFMGFDPSIDDRADEAMAEYDNRRVKQIVQRTGKFIQRGSRPKLVIEHEKEGRPTAPEAVGDITSVRYEERNGVGYIVGDVEMPKDRFDDLLASNAYPRRSAEIWKDNHLSEVALLGRDTPRRPLPDTKFTKAGSKVVFERPMGVVSVSIDSKENFAEMGVGGGLNTFIPTAGTKRKNMARKHKHRMDAEAEAEAKKALEAAAEDDFPEMEDEDEAEMAYAADDAAIEEEEGEDEFCDVDSEKVKYEDEDEMPEDEDKFEDDVHVDIGSHEGDEDEDEMEAEAAYGGKHKMSKGRTSEKALFARVQELERQLRLERFGREVDSMIRDGYRCSKFRNSMVEELADAANPSAKISFWKATMAKSPINVPTVAQHTVTDEGSVSMDVKAATARAVHEAAGDLTKFKSLFAKYSGQKA